MLFHRKPGAIKNPLARVVDESFLKAGLHGCDPDQPAWLAVPTLGADLDDLHGPEYDLAISGRRTLERALSRCNDGKVSRKILEDEGFTAELARDLAKVEWSRKPRNWKGSASVEQMTKELLKMAGRFTARVPETFDIIAKAFADEGTDRIPGLVLRRDHKLPG